MYEIVLLVIVLNLVYELIEIVFPIQKMRMVVKSFTLFLMLYIFCDYFLTLV